MTALPTLDVTDPTTYNRLVAAFHSDPAEYKTWLKRALADEVQRRESATIIDTANAQVAQNAADIARIVSGTT